MDRRNRNKCPGLNFFPIKLYWNSDFAFADSNQGFITVSRFWLRMVSVVSLAAYLLANTNVSSAMEYWIRSRTAKPKTCAVVGEKKCSHCRDKARSTNQDSPTSDNSGCPCCPKDSNQKNCPCPDGFALCSAAKTPCLNPINFDFHPQLCLDGCTSMESFDYFSPFRGSLDRPPR